MKTILKSELGNVKIIPLLFLVFAVGILSFLLIVSSAPFSGIFAHLFPKKSSLAASIPPNCTDSLQSKINAAVSGGTVTLTQNCVYREAVNISKPMTLDGGLVAQIRGSDIWTGWTQSGSVWTHGGLPSMANTSSQCESGTSRCDWPQQVFLDGTPLLQVAANPVSGQFSVSGSTVTIADNPSSHTIEVTTRPNWIMISSSNVTIKNATMMHAAGTGIDRRSGGMNGITIQNNTLSDSHYANIEEDFGGSVLTNDIFRGGCLGVASSPTLFKGNKLHDNNTEQCDRGWEAGGLKAVVLSNVTWDSNEVYNNEGAGFWCDIGCTNVTISNNRIHDNTWYGILYEISRSGHVFGNTLWGNGKSYQFYGGGPGIFLSTAATTEVYNNTLAWNQTGILIQSQPRGNDFNGVPYPYNDNYLHNNAVILDHDGYGLAWIGQTPSQNHSDSNQFWYNGGVSTEGVGKFRFIWSDTNYTSLTSFNNTPGGGGTVGNPSSYISDTQKNQVLTANNMPNCATCTIPTPNPVPTSTPMSVCQGSDIDHSGVVNIFDYNILVGDFGKSGAGLQGDIDNNSIVNIFDYNTLVGNFGKTGC